jgi:hypothetical protein
VDRVEENAIGAEARRRRFFRLRRIRVVGRVTLCAPSRELQIHGVQRTARPT